MLTLENDDILIIFNHSGLVWKQIDYFVEMLYYFTFICESEALKMPIWFTCLIFW